MNKEEEIEAFYKKVADKCTAMCTTGYEARLAYAKAINSSGKSFEDKYKDSKNIEEDIYDAISMENCVNNRLTIGAPGKEAMEKVIALEKEYLAKNHGSDWLKQ